jgi:hypothetical protein
MKLYGIIRVGYTLEDGKLNICTVKLPFVNSSTVEITLIGQGVPHVLLKMDRENARKFAQKILDEINE